MPPATRIYLHRSFRQDWDRTSRSRTPPGKFLIDILNAAKRNPEGSRFRKIRGPQYYPLDSGYFLEASLFRAHVRGSGGHRVIFAILKKEQERRRIVVAIFLSERTKRDGFRYDFKSLDARLERVVQDYLAHDLESDYFEPWNESC